MIKPIGKAPYLRKSQSSEYRSWCKAKSRCHNTTDKQFNDYGGRGISMCDDWRNSFNQFYKDMGDKPTPSHSIERIDNTKGYSPENCKWATRKEQCRNRRSCVYVTYEGETKTVTEWAELLGCKGPTLAKRLREGWSIERAFTTPIGY